MNNVIPDSIRDPASSFLSDRLDSGDFQGSGIPDRVRDDLVNGEMTRWRVAMGSEFAHAARKRISRHIPSQKNHPPQVPIQSGRNMF
ncbi:hypothetical protein [Sphingobium lignivorans]|uniref:hypothetical protein n=1 Tax=Sphingobium lignivorans TaxID=2735886 RepID=UPI001608C303|nr:hypothetical protein [Sphingobium lignivorans]